jgi:hypothetical protein
MVYGIFGLIVAAVFGGSLLSYFLYPPYNLSPSLYKTLILFVSFLGGWFGYELSKFNLGSSIISLSFYRFSVFSGSI